MSRPVIPVVLVAGFLGSGKTTLLNTLLRKTAGDPTDGTRIGVLVNDFGSVNIDGLLVAGQADGTVTLTGGCMCCSVDADGLDAALSSLVRPAAQIDAIVIEASGIAEPGALIRMLTSLNDPRLRYGGLVYVVDAATFGELRHTHRSLDDHVGIADLVVLNKTDLIDADALSTVQATLRRLNSGAPLLPTVDADIDPVLLFDATPAAPAEVDRPRQLTLDALLTDTEPNGPHDSGCDGKHRHLHDDYVVVEFEVADAMDPRALAAFLREPPTGTYRIKGITWFDQPGHRRRYVVHSVGGFVRVTVGPWSGTDLSTESGTDPSTTIVVIGVDLDPEAVRSALTAAVATERTALDEYGILHITRHL